MPPKRLRSDIRITSSEIILSCEWEDCRDVFDDMEAFIKHMELHLSQKSYLIENRDDVYQCGWRDCGMQVIGALTDFHRHSFFHCFHIKIKSIGQLLIDKTKQQGCLLDTQSRNLIPELPERLQCGWKHCDTILDNPEVFYRHVDNHAFNFPDGKKLKQGCKCDWEGCDVVTKDRYKMREHLRSHTQERIVGCPTCGGLFSSRTKFFDHLKRQEEHSLLCYQCSHCNKRFSTERLLRDHVRHHVNQYKCMFCDMTCPTPSSLKSHIRYRHTNEKPFKCDLCQHSTKTLADLRRHLESHNEEVPFRCHMSGCNYTARCYASLANHFKKKHQNMETQKYACHVCTSVFTRGGKLTKHLKKNHNFKWPSGHSRFRYKLHEDGYFRLQTVRYESIQLSEQMQEEDSNDSSSKGEGSNEGTTHNATVTVSKTVTMETDDVTVDTGNMSHAANTEADVIRTLYGNSEMETSNMSDFIIPEEGTVPVQIESENIRTVKKRKYTRNVDSVGENNMSDFIVPEEGAVPVCMEPENIRTAKLKKYTRNVDSAEENSVSDFVIPEEGTVPVRIESDLKVLSVTYKGNEGVKQSFSIQCNGQEEDMRYNLEMLGDVAMLVPEERSGPYLKLPCQTLTVPSTSMPK